MLLDTHTLLWLLDDETALGPKARSLINSASAVHASAASAWELAIKAARGRFKASPDFVGQVNEAGLVWLSVTTRHAWAVRTLSGLPHRDPFDRLLVAQAADEQMVLLTADRAILAATVSPAVTVINARM